LELFKGRKEEILGGRKLLPKGWLDFIPGGLKGPKVWKGKA